MIVTNRSPFIYEKVSIESRAVNATNEMKISKSILVSELTEIYNFLYHYPCKSLMTCLHPKCRKPDAAVIAS
jgi:hypothetical protein